MDRAFINWIIILKFCAHENKTPEYLPCGVFVCYLAWIPTSPRKLQEYIHSPCWLLASGARDLEHIKLGLNFLNLYHFLFRVRGEQVLIIVSQTQEAALLLSQGHSLDQILLFIHPMMLLPMVDSTAPVEEWGSTCGLCEVGKKKRQQPWEGNLPLLSVPTLVIQGSVWEIQDWWMCNEPLHDLDTHVPPATSGSQDAPEVLLFCTARVMIPASQFLRKPSTWAREGKENH